MIFKDIFDKEIIQLENFYKRYNSLPMFIETDVTVIFDNTSMKENIELEFSDFENLKKFLQKVENGGSKYFTFQNLEEQFKIFFEVTDLHLLNITGFLKNKMYTSELKFSFQMDRIQQKDLISSLERMISHHEQ